MIPFDCLECLLGFFSVEGAQQHCITTGHLVECKPCGKRSLGPTALTQHAHHKTGDTDPERTEERGNKSCDLHSEAGEPASSHLEFDAYGHRIFKCLFCDRVFRFASAIAMHVESGSHGATRHQVTAAVHKLGIVPTISVDRRLEAPIEPPATIVTYSATEEAFNGYSYQCFFCHCKYATMRGLNAHLNSPAHDADEFKCPKCRTQFKLVSGLLQHIESGTCGIAEMKEVQDHFDNLTDQFTRALKF